MVTPAEPSDFERLGVVVVMSIHRTGASDANLARAAFDFSCPYRTTDDAVRGILHRIVDVSLASIDPIRVTRVRFLRDLTVPSAVARDPRRMPSSVSGSAFVASAPVTLVRVPRPVLDDRSRHGALSLYR